MAPVPNLIRARILHAPLCKVAAQSPNLLTLIQSTSRTFRALPRGPAAITSTRRCFWWGRHGYRQKYSSGTASYHKCLEALNRVSKPKSEKAPTPLHRSSYPIYYSYGHGWRLASSWGKSREDSKDIPNDKSKGEADREKEWKTETEKWQEELNTHLDRLRKRVESHPYETLFGASMKNGAWNPWGVDWDNWMRNLGWKDLASGRFASTKPGSQGSSQTGAAQGYYERQESKQSASSPLPENTSTESGDIDLITLRRIQRDTPDTVAAKKNCGNRTQYDIPVKKYRPAETRQSSDGEAPKAGTLNAQSGFERFKRTVEAASPRADVAKPLATPLKTWLAREGFSEDVRSKSKDETSGKLTDRNVPTTSGSRSQRLESSLDRHLRTVGHPTWESNPPRSSLSYNPEENKTEDVDLLRASNVRAAAGQLRRPSQETTEAREKRLTSLEAAFEKRQQDPDQKFASEVGQSAVTKCQPQTNKDPLRPVILQHSGNKKKMDGKHRENSLIFEGLNMNKISSEEPLPANVDAWGYDLAPKGLETVYQDELDNKMQSLENYYARQQQELLEAEEQRMAGKRKAADAALAKEINAQKVAMTDFEDMRCGRGPTCQGTTSVRSGEGDISPKSSEFAGLSGWFKRKAPHLTQRDEQKAKDSRIVREIRQIYEERYGTIDAQHRQPRGTFPLEGKGDSAVQESLRIYDEKPASGESNSGTAGQVCSTDLEQSAVQEGLREYDEKLAADDCPLAAGGRSTITDPEDKAVQDGLRDYDEKTTKPKEIPGTTCRHDSNELGDPTVQEGLRAYDEKMTAKENILAVNGTVAHSEMADSAVQGGLREYDEMTAAQHKTLGPTDTVQKGLREYDETITAQDHSLSAEDNVQRGLRDYDGKMASKDNFVGASDTVREGLRDYDEKIAAQEDMLAAEDTVQEGLREFDEKIASKGKVLGTSDTVASSKMEDQSVQEGLRAYDEKVSAEALAPLTKGRIASTDLDIQEIALLGAHQSQASRAKVQRNPSPSLKESLPGKVQPASSIYKVLAYDRATDSIATATTTSSLHASTSAPRSASSILTHLENPAKYFDHFEPLEAAGFELVAGSRQSLVFKKVREDYHSDLRATQTTSDKSSQIESSAVASDIGKVKIPERVKEQHEPHETPLKQSEDVQGKLDEVQTRGGRLEYSTGNQAEDPDAERMGLKIPLVPFWRLEDSGNRQLRYPAALFSRIQRAKIARLMSEREASKEVEDALNPMDPIAGTSVNTKSSRLTDSTSDASTAPFTRNPASEALSPPSIPQAKAPVHREEEVFSGRNIMDEQRRERQLQRRLIVLALRDQESRENSRRTRQKVWKNVKRLFWSGAVVAGCFYLVGALLEKVYRPSKRVEEVVEDWEERKRDGEQVVTPKHYYVRR